MRRTKRPCPFCSTTSARSSSFGRPTKGRSAESEVSARPVRGGRRSLTCARHRPSHRANAMRPCRTGASSGGNSRPVIQGDRIRNPAETGRQSRRERVRCGAAGNGGCDYALRAGWGSMKIQIASDLHLEGRAGHMPSSLGVPHGARPRRAYSRWRHRPRDAGARPSSAVNSTPPRSSTCPAITSITRSGSASRSTPTGTRSRPSMGEPALPDRSRRRNRRRALLRSALVFGPVGRHGPLGPARPSTMASATSGSRATAAASGRSPGTSIITIYKVSCWRCRPARWTW